MPADYQLHSPDVTEKRPVPQGPRYRLKKDPTSSHSVILRFVGFGRGRKVLDVGTADGFLAGRLTENGWQVTGIEAEPDLARSAERFCTRVIPADLNAGIPPLGERFDAIVYGDVLEHLVHPNEVFTQLNEWLVPGGLVVVSVPNIAHLWIRLGLLFGRFEYGERGILDKTHLRFFTLGTFRHFLARHGIRPHALTAIPAPVELLVPGSWQGAWLGTFQRVHAWAAHCWPQGLAYQFVARGTKE